MGKFTFLKQYNLFSDAFRLENLFYSALRGLGSLALIFSLTACYMNASITDINDNSKNSSSVTPPAVFISNPSIPKVVGGGESVSYTLTFTDASEINLTLSHISLMTTGTAYCDIGLTGTGLSSRLVTLSHCSGTGTVAIVVGAGAAQDEKGNTTAPSVATTIVFVDDPAVEFISASSSVQEDAGAINIPVTLVLASSSAMTVSYAATGGTATGGGTDYDLASGFLTFSPGETTKNISVTLNNDSLIETSETIVISLTNPAGGILGTKTSHTLTIVDDDATRFVELSDAEVVETEPLSYTAYLSSPHTSDISLDWTLVDESTNGALDLAGTSGTLTIPAGQTMASLTLNSLSDFLAEGVEKFKIQIQNINGPAASTKAYGSGQILDSIKGVSSIQVGPYHTCILLESGAVYCVGNNGYGKLGNGNTESQAVPVLVNGLSAGVSKISVGSDNSCAVTAAGAALCWGSNYYKVVGDGTPSDKSTPTPVVGLGANVTDISVASYHACAVQAGAVFCWGDESKGEVGNDTTLRESDLPPTQVSGLTSNISKVTAGGKHSCALKTTGEVYCWGSNEFGQLGNGTTTNSGVPVAVTGLAGVATDIKVGGSYSGYYGISCALIQGGTVQCWGSNGDGAIGIPYNVSSSYYKTPQTVQGLHSAAVKIGIYSKHACAVLDTGELQCWGANDSNQMGDASGDLTNHFAPVTVFGMSSGVTGVSEGSAANAGCLILATKEAKCWGLGKEPMSIYNDYYNQFAQRNRILPSQIDRLYGTFNESPSIFAKADEGQNRHQCYVGSDARTVFCFGANKYGQLGNGTLVDSKIPSPVIGLPNLTILQLSVSGGSTCALMVDQTIYCWGHNSDGQLGNSTTTDSSIPVAVVGLGGAASMISVGTAHSCALLSNGSVKCWGSNTNWELGTGNQVSSLIPTPVIDLSGPASKLYLFTYSSCVLLVSGEVQCWNYASNGIPKTVTGFSGTVVSLNGDGSINSNGIYDFWSSNYFVQPSNILQNFVQIIDSYNFSCGLENNGDIYCWGNKRLIGFDKPGYQPIPVRLSGQPVAATQLFGGNDFACFKGVDAKIYCWGMHPQKSDPYIDRPEFMTTLNKPILTLEPASSNEGSSITFIGSLNSTTSVDVTFIYSVTGGTAISGVDYVPATGSVTIPAGQSTGNFSVTTLANTAGEKNRFANVEITGVTNAHRGNQYTLFTIKDNDPLKFQMEGIGTTIAGRCSTGIRVSTHNYEGVLANVNSNEIIQLTGAGAGSFYLDNTCTQAISQVTIANGFSDKLIYFKSNVAESLVLNATSANFGSSTLLLTVQSALPANQLKLIGANQGMASTCSTFIVYAMDANQLPVAVPALTPVTLESSGGSFYSDLNCTNPTTSVNILTDTGMIHAYFKSNVVGTYSLEATATGLTSTPFIFQTVVNSASRIIWTGSQSINPSTCTLFEVKIEDAYGNPYISDSPRTITFSGGGTGAFHSNASCSATSATATVLANDYKTSIYFTDAATESLYLVGSQSATVKGYHPLVVNQASLYKLEMTGSQAIAINACEPLTIQTKDYLGNSYNVLSDLTVTLGGDGAAAYYPASNCSGIITTTTITTGNNSITVYFKSASALSLRLSSAATGYQTGFLPVVVGAPAVSAQRILLNGPISINAGTCQAYSVNIVDNQYNSALITGTNKTINLTGNQGGKFYSDGGCSTPVTSVAVVVGSSTQTFYFKSLMKQNFIFSAAGASLTTGTLNVQVQSSGLAQLKLLGPSDIVRNECAPFRIRTQDTLGNAKEITVDTPVDLSITSGAGAIYSDADCTLPITQSTVLQNNYEQTVYVKSPTSGKMVLSVSDPNTLLVADSFNVIIKKPITKVAVGYRATCAIADGGVHCTGEDFVRKKFDGHLIVPGLEANVVDVGLSGSYEARFGCALLNTQEVKCWGAGRYGELGTGNSVETTATAVPVIGLGSGSGVIELAVGNIHSCALLNTGEVRCWGNNYRGSLGNNSQIQSSIPVTVQGLGPGSGVIKIKTSGDSTCAMTAGNSLKCWGRNWGGELGNGTRIDSWVPVAVTPLDALVADFGIGTDHGCALLTDNSVQCWGQNNFSGALGNGSTAESLVPVPVTGLASGVAQLAVGGTHSCVILQTSNQLHCWGSNSSGQLGLGSTSSKNIPTEVKTTSFTVSQIFLKGSNTCALSALGALQCWGNNYASKLTAQQIEIPFKVGIRGLESGVVDVKVGDNLGCALLNDGSVKCWGKNDGGQLGDNTTTNSSVPVVVQGLTGPVTEISMSDSNTCALINDGTVQCWGTSFAGNSAVTIASLSGVIDISRGPWNTCAVLNTNEVYCWGHSGGFYNNSSGQLGDGTRTPRNTPTKVLWINNAVQVAAAQFATCILTTSGGVKCWGDNYAGQLGDGTWTSSLVPVDVTGLTSGVLSIEAGFGDYDDAFCAIMINGEMYCWGDDGARLGLGENYGDTNVPQKVRNLNSIAKASIGSYSSCGLTTEGVPYCWGMNYYGQNGSGTYEKNYTPLPVAGVDKPVTSISTNRDYDGNTCMVENGAVYCWGKNGDLNLFDIYTDTFLGVGQSSSYISLPLDVFILQ